MAAIDEEKGPKESVRELAKGGDEEDPEFAHLLPADLSLWRTLWQTLKTIVTTSDSSPDIEYDGFNTDFETWVHNRYKKRILYRYNKDFVLDMAALQSMCMHFRLKRISKQAFNIITSTPENIEPLCEVLDGELRDYSESRQAPYTINFG